MPIELPYNFPAAPVGSDEWKLAQDLLVIAESISAAGIVVFLDTRFVPLTYELPTGPMLNDLVIIKDRYGHASINNAMITTTDNTLIDGQPYKMLNVNYGSFNFIWNGDGWSLT